MGKIHGGNIRRQAGRRLSGWAIGLALDLPILTVAAINVEPSLWLPVQLMGKGTM